MNGQVVVTASAASRGDDTLVFDPEAGFPRGLSGGLAAAGVAAAVALAIALAVPVGSAWCWPSG